MLVSEWPRLSETEKREKIAQDVADLATYDVELHLSTDPDLPKKYGKAIKAAGGRYSEARRTTCDHRYVSLPNTERELINKLVAEFGFWPGARSNDRVTMVVRLRNGDHRLPTQVAVGGVAKACADPMDAFERRFVRKLWDWRSAGENCGLVTNAEIAARDEELKAAIADQKAQQKLGALLYAAKPTSLDEFDVIVSAVRYAVQQTELQANDAVIAELARIEGPQHRAARLGQYTIAMNWLERVNAARVEFVKPEPTLAESLDGRLPPFDMIIANNTEKSS